MAMMPGANDLGGLARLRDYETRSISPENRDGARGGGGRAVHGTGERFARDLGPGWKISPNIVVEPGETADIAAVDGEGVLRHLWFTTGPTAWRTLIVRMFWDGDAQPAVEVPLGDLFGQGWAVFAQLTSAPVAVNPNGGLNCYWPMPFHRSARITVENIGHEPANLYYEVTYDLGAIEADEAYFHAQWRRSNPLVAGTTHVLLDGIEGRGQYVGTFLAWGVNSRGWWGEGEMRFFLDGDDEHPTINGTGTEDYFGGAWDFHVPGRGYTEFSTPYLGLHQVIRPDGLYESQERFGMYRWHVLDAIRFREGIRVDVQALGWRSGSRYLARHDDIASTAFFYLDATSCTRPTLPPADELEVL